MDQKHSKETCHHTMVLGVQIKKINLSTSWILIHNFYDLKNLKFAYFKIVSDNLHKKMTLFSGGMAA